MPDIHYPKTDKPTLRALLDFITKNKSQIAGFIFGGDQLDNECISHHTKGKPIFRPTGQYKRDQDGFDREVLTPIEQALGGGKERYWMQGNHERFTDDLIEEQPELAGAIDRIVTLRLRERGWKIIPLGCSLKIGRVVFIHGDVISGGGQFPTKRALETYCSTVVMGHTHAPQSFTKILPHDQTQKWMAFVSPILGRVDPSYLRKRPTGWLNGWTTVEMRDKGLFNVYPTVVVGGRFSLGGIVYGGNKNRKKAAGRVPAQSAKKLPRRTRRVSSRKKKALRA